MRIQSTLQGPCERAFSHLAIVPLDRTRQHLVLCILLSTNILSARLEGETVNREGGGGALVLTDIEE